MNLTWLDSNSWLIEMGGQRVLLDPWLVGPLVFGNLPWLFKGDRPMARTIPDAIDVILLSQGLEDHAHPPTLRQLDHAIPVVGSANAAKVVQKLGYTQVTALAHHQSTTIGGLKIQAVPGSPIGPTLVENGYLLTDLSEGTTLYYEPHGYHSPTLKSVAPVDVVIAPIIDLEIPLLGPIIKGSQSALQVAEWLRPQVLVPTAAGGDVSFEGLLMSVLRARGSATEMQQLLHQHHLETRILELQPGERTPLELTARQTA
ncbi:MAG: MBL fold metallo-hydrolase [Synechococcales cyanobacterium M58_A2018_015]|nr:MBL fold metallo-hydrolase [Synechococcales cyanobacterium M58_A2018_015]